MKKIAWLLALLAFGASAQVYKWVDDKGQVHYGEQPPPEAKTTKPTTRPRTKASAANTSRTSSRC
jgi:hypothetical protein